MSIIRVFASAFVFSIISSASYAQFSPTPSGMLPDLAREATTESQIAGCNGKAQGQQCTFQSYSMPASGIGNPTADKTTTGTCQKITREIGYGGEISSLQCE